MPLTGAVGRDVPSQCGALRAQSYVVVIPRVAAPSGRLTRGYAWCGPPGRTWPIRRLDSSGLGRNPRDGRSPRSPRSRPILCCCHTPGCGALRAPHPGLCMVRPSGPNLAYQTTRFVWSGPKPQGRPQSQKSPESANSMLLSYPGLRRPPGASPGVMHGAALRAELGRSDDSTRLVWAETPGTAVVPEVPGVGQFYVVVIPRVAAPSGRLTRGYAWCGPPGRTWPIRRLDSSGLGRNPQGRPQSQESR
ncbi:hypothetical protein J3R75_003188 [Oligosphaera ethanolica]|uniref:Uncharacterized protein n=1 Tax=Oligosphaera ethanolica TaxID=760260 RepID=A0AAE3VIU8_9BACT|nr:hypothetical protein [Oligosphaera ethanolica]